MIARRLLVVIAAFALAGCRKDDVHLEDAQRIAYETKPAVVRVSALATAVFRYRGDAILDVEGQLRAAGYSLSAKDVPAEDARLDTGAGGSGSGFIVSPDGVIVTSGHVVAPTRDPAALDRDLLHNGAISALVRHFPVDVLRMLYRDDQLEKYVAIVVASAALENRSVVNRVELSNGEMLPFTIRGFSPSLLERGVDVALLQVPRRDLPTLSLGDSDDARVGDAIWAVGYPSVASSTDDLIGGWLSRESDLEATFNPGTITAIKRDITNMPVFQSNVAIYAGNSGGPVVNREAQVVAISTWGHKNAEQIKFLVPVSAVRRSLATAKVAPDRSSAFDTAYRAALDAASDGEWTEAKKKLAIAEPLFRNSPDVVRLRRDIERGEKSAPAWLQRSTLLAVLVIGAIVLLAVALAVAASRRRSAGPAFVVPPASGPETVVAPDGGIADPARVLGRFTILNGSMAGKRLGLGGSGIRIGRESSVCEIVLENPKVSRLHAEVVSIDGKVMLIDRNSSNGTYVNDQKIDRRHLKDGDIIYFGGRNAVAVAYHV